MCFGWTPSKIANFSNICLLFSVHLVLFVLLLYKKNWMAHWILIMQNQLPGVEVAINTHWKNDLNSTRPLFDSWHKVIILQGREITIPINVTSSKHITFSQMKQKKIGSLSSIRLHFYIYTAQNNALSRNETKPHNDFERWEEKKQWVTPGNFQSQYSRSMNCKMTLS